MPARVAPPKEKRAVLAAQDTFEIVMDKFQQGNIEEERYLQKIEHKMARTDLRAQEAHAAADNQLELNNETVNNLQHSEGEAAVTMQQLRQIQDAAEQNYQRNMGHASGAQQMPETMFDRNR